MFRHEYLVKKLAKISKIGKKCQNKWPKWQNMAKNAIKVKMQKKGDGNGQKRGNTYHKTKESCLVRPCSGEDHYLSLSICDELGNRSFRLMLLILLLETLFRWILLFDPLRWSRCIFFIWCDGIYYNLIYCCDIILCHIIMSYFVT